jgi:hypothetical protein
MSCGWGGRLAGTSGSGEMAGKGGRRMNLILIMCIHMYVNAKMIPVVIVPGIGGENNGK